MNSVVSEKGECAWIRYYIEYYLRELHGKQKNIAFMNVKKAFDRVDRRYMEGNTAASTSVRSFYENSKRCLRLGREESEMFIVQLRDVSMIV